MSEVAPWWNWATHHPIARIGRRWHLSISSTLVLARSANDAGASTAAQSGRTKGWFLPVPPTLLCWHVSVSPTVRSPYPTGQVRRKESSRFAVSRNERHCAVLIRSANAAAQLVLRTQAERKAASAPHSDEMKGDASPHHSTPLPPLRDLKS